MQKTLFPLAKAIATASLLSVGLSACVAGDGDQSSSTQTSAAPSSEAQSSSVMSSVAPSSSSVMSSSSSSVMSSSSEAVADCSDVDTTAGENFYLSGPVNCTGCHGTYDGNTFPGGTALPRAIDPNALTATNNADLADYIAQNMANVFGQSCGADAACIERAEEISKYINKLSNNTEWCAGDTSSEAASSSSQPNQQAGVNCDNSPDLIACLDFENGDTDGFSGAGGSVRIVSGEESHSGNSALKLTGQGWLTKNDMPGSHWGRVFYKNAVKPNNVPNWSHTTFIKGEAGGAQFRFVDMVAAPDSDAMSGFYQHLYNTEPNDLSLEGSYSNQYNGDWVCFEWSMNTDTQIYRMYIDGDEVSLANWGTPSNSTDMPNATKWDGSMHPMTPVPATLSRLSIGMQNYQNHYYEFYLDDIAIGTTRIGCDI